MDKTEITQGEYQSIMGNNPSFYHGSSRLPVEALEWEQAILFCNLKSKSMGLDTVYYLSPNTSKYLIDYNKNGFRLPTEAEWEFACRAGSEGDYYGNINWGNINEISKYEWIEDNSSDRTHEVGSKKPNPFGLYDMLGNVSEWCNDFYDSTYYKVSPQIDPVGADTGTWHIYRGGNNKTLFTGCYSRNYCVLWSSLGFRCVRRKM